jgi:hypothetical protein
MNEDQARGPEVNAVLGKEPHCDKFKIAEWENYGAENNE